MKSVYNDIAREFFIKRNFLRAIEYQSIHLTMFVDDAEGWLNLGKALTFTEQFEEAERVLLRSCELAPDRVNYLLDLQVLYTLTSNAEKYVPIVERLKREIPNEKRLIFNCAWDRIKAGETYEGFADLEVGRQEGFFGSDYTDFKGVRLPSLEKIKGNKIAIIGEGGLGDEIIASRYASLIKKYDGTPILYVSESLHSILGHLAKCRKGADSVNGGKNFSDINNSIEFDYYIPGMASAALFKEIPNEVYLFAKPEYIEKHKIISDKKKVGICWHGNTSYEWEQIRGIPKDLMFSLKDDKIELFNLQKGETDLQLDSWDDTLGIIANLDCVVSSCTSIVHAAAGMGKRVYLLTPLAPYYVWTSKEKWYQDVIIFNKDQYNGYAKHIETIRGLICQ